MSTQIDNTMIQFDRIDPLQATEFKKEGVVGDWRNWNIIFPIEFPREDVRVIVTESNWGLDLTEHNAAVVGIVRSVTSQGFTLSARNSEDVESSANFNWMAVLEDPGSEEEYKTLVDLRRGVRQRKRFPPKPWSGQTHERRWEVKFSPLFLDEPPTVLLTANNLNVAPFYQWVWEDEEGPLKYHNAAVVGSAQDVTPEGFTLTARSTDCGTGHCGFYYVALSQGTGGNSNLWIDTGRVSPKYFASGGERPGDWRGWRIIFHKPFFVPPVVLVTPNNLDVEGPNPAVVGIARNVTTDGFILGARNSDCSPGKAGFYWVAVGYRWFE